MTYTKFLNYNIDTVVYGYYNIGLTSIQLMSNEEGPIATATINPSPWTIAELNFPLDMNWNIVVDTNNCGEEIINWLIENNIAKPTRWQVQQGYCTYPVMRLVDKH